MTPWVRVLVMLVLVVSWAMLCYGFYWNGYEDGRADPRAPVARLARNGRQHRRFGVFVGFLLAGWTLALTMAGVL